MSAELVVSVAAITDRGLRRSHNEDTIAVGSWRGNGPMSGPHTIVHRFDASLLLLVADGLGGHAGGEKASRIAAEHITGQAGALDGETAVADCVRAANRAVYQATQTAPEDKGMGTTVAGVVLRSNGHLHFNVGDSRVYRYKAGFLRQLTIDDVRSPGAEPADGRRGSAPLTQCLGGSVAMSEVAPHVGTEPMVPGWRYLLCSDGLTDMVPLERIESLLNEHADDAIAVAALLEAALAGGGEDNISIIIATVGGPA